MTSPSQSRVDLQLPGPHSELSFSGTGSCQVQGINTVTLQRWVGVRNIQPPISSLTISHVIHFAFPPFSPEHLHSMHHSAVSHHRPHLNMLSPSSSMCLLPEKSEFSSTKLPVAMPLFLLISLIPPLPSNDSRLHRPREQRSIVRPRHMLLPIHGEKSEFTH